MFTPTGTLDCTAERMKWAFEEERSMNLLVENEQWYQAMTAKTQCEARKARAALEFLGWILAVLQMPPEPTAKEIEEAYEARKAAK